MPALGAQTSAARNCGPKRGLLVFLACLSPASFDHSELATPDRERQVWQGRSGFERRVGQVTDRPNPICDAKVPSRNLAGTTMHNSGLWSLLAISFGGHCSKRQLRLLSVLSAVTFLPRL